MLIIDDTNWKTQVGDGKEIIVGGEKRLLSAMPKPAGHNSRGYSKLFGAEVPTIPRSEWSARIKEQSNPLVKARVSDHQRYASDNQGSFPTCWSAGTMAAFATARVMQMGFAQYLRFSAMAVAVPISGGNSGGYEGDAVEYLTKYGGVPVDLWGYTERVNKNNNPQVQAARLRYKLLESYECNGFDEFATACLLGFPCTISYNWWSHVVMLCDLVEIEPGSFGFRIRNNWGESYGDKNEYGFGGYAVMREGRGTPSGGFALRQVMSSLAVSA